MICRHMHWSWDQYESTPQPVIEELVGLLSEEVERRENERRMAEMKAKRV